ncbi:hypothetical protein SAMN04488561_6488 [Jiangella alba]|uniref:Uncharacterized protein n=1 Tax=Jiangella alba TaxID=561176 RepID=A0A1H5PZK5_9ACTN|nr:hypothetical protein SAMN04488561_6488 [Jiangella alba]
MAPANRPSYRRTGQSRSTMTTGSPRSRRGPGSTGRRAAWWPSGAGRAGGRPRRREAAPADGRAGGRPRRRTAPMWSRPARESRRFTPGSHGPPVGWVPSRPGGHPTPPPAANRATAGHDPHRSQSRTARPPGTIRAATGREPHDRQARSAPRPATIRTAARHDPHRRQPRTVPRPATTRATAGRDPRRGQARSAPRPAATRMTAGRGRSRRGAPLPAGDAKVVRAPGGSDDRRGRGGELPSSDGCHVTVRPVPSLSTILITDRTAPARDEARAR